LYTLGEQCGGNYKHSGKKKTKACLDCHLPHMPDYYDTIVEKIKNTGRNAK